VIYIVPTMASIKTGPLKSQLYGVRKIEMSENVHTEATDITFALSGMAPVSRNSPTCRPNRRLLTTKLYSRSDDLTKSAAAIMSQIVPGIPGSTYPIMPNPRKISPKVTNSNRLNLSRASFNSLFILGWPCAKER